VAIEKERLATHSGIDVFPNAVDNRAGWKFWRTV
jgi:hypothetical protein